MLRVLYTLYIVTWLHFCLGFTPPQSSPAKGIPTAILQSTACRLKHPTTVVRDASPRTVCYQAWCKYGWKRSRTSYNIKAVFYASCKDEEVTNKHKPVASLPPNLSNARKRAREEDRELWKAKGNGSDGVGGYDPLKDKLPLGRETANVGDPQKVQTQSMNIQQVMTELQAIQSQGPKKYCILGTRHCSFLHQQIVEMLAYALVLSGNHLYTSGAAGTNAAAIRGALRAFQPQLLTVVLPQSMSKQTPESQELLEDVTNVVTMPQNDKMPLDVASRICNSHLLSQTDHLISFAFHESKTVIEATKEAQKLDMLVTLLYLD